ncbi:MAG: CHAT domain-containing protein, partial [Immundisolibacteraceae bacterium]|nr:CHAT domain-containing protein [Immundisolibacteraceae bacterium]
NLNFVIGLDHQVGRPQVQRKQYREANQTYRKILKVSYLQGNLMGISIGLGVLADIHDKLDQSAEGMDILLLAYKVALLQNNRFESGAVEKTIANNLQKRDRALALVWRLKAKESLAGTPYVFDYVTLLVELADDLKWFGRKQEAMRLYHDAYVLRAKIGGDPNVRWVKKNADYNLAKNLFYQDQCEAALPVFVEHLLNYSEQRDRGEWYYSRMLHLHGQCLQQMGDQDQAALAFMKAYASYDVRRANANSDKDRAVIDRNSSPLVNSMVEFLADSGQIEQALLTLETNKAKTLTDIQADPAQRKVYQQWQALRAKQRQEQESLFEVKEDLLERLSMPERMQKYYELQVAHREQEFQLKLALESTQRKVAADISPATLKAIVANLPVDTAVLSLFVNQDSVGLFLITNNRVTYRQSDYAPRELRTRIEEIKFMIGNPKVDYFKIPIEEIYQRVFATVVDGLAPDIKRLVVSTDGVFQNIPLGMLYDGERFLAQRFVIQQVASLRHYAPDDSANFVLPGAGITCVDPDVYGRRLPFQRDTSAAIKTIATQPVTELAGQDCSSENIVSNVAKLTGQGFLHIGAHGSLVEYEPMDSGVMLSSETGERLWNAVDIGTADLNNIQLLTLSSCNAAVLDNGHPRDVFGLLRGVAYAGVKNVVAPLWPVNDHATSQLMQSFYGFYLQHGDPAQALHQAQSQMINSDRYQHPFYWAAFISMGIS